MAVQQQSSRGGNGVSDPSAWGAHVAPPGEACTPAHREWTEPFNSFNSWKGLLYREHYQAILEGRLLPPIEAAIDPTYSCNVDCVWCNSRRVLRQPGVAGQGLQADHLVRLVSFLADWGVRGFCFAGGGEPTLHPALWDALQIARQRGRENAILTNGICLDEDRKREIAVTTCRWIGVSLDAGTPERYAQVKNTDPDNFRRVLENVAAMVDLARQHGSHCEIAIKYLIHPSNADQILQACTLARDLGVAHFHARPAASENIEGLGGRLQFPMECIDEQLERCLELQTPTFKTFGVRHKFTRTFNLEHGFSRCWSAPLAIQCGADGRVYHCIDWRGNKDFVLGTHWPDPERILEFWGSPGHLQRMRSIQVDKCPRCTYGVYARQIENAMVDDRMCVNFP